MAAIKCDGWHCQPRCMRARGIDTPVPFDSSNANGCSICIFTPVLDCVAKYSCSLYWSGNLAIEHLTHWSTVDSHDAYATDASAIQYIASDAFPLFSGYHLWTTMIV